MPKTTVEWCWDEAFCKFGFDDGDGLVMTGEVASFIESLGYATDIEGWGIHNTVIMDVKKNGKSVVFKKLRYEDGSRGDEPTIGYDDPRKYLPEKLWKALDEKFGKETCFG